MRSVSLILVSFTTIAITAHATPKTRQGKRFVIYYIQLVVVESFETRCMKNSRHVATDINPQLDKVENERADGKYV